MAIWENHASGATANTLNVMVCGSILLARRHLSLLSFPEARVWFASAHLLVLVTFSCISQTRRQRGEATYRKLNQDKMSEFPKECVHKVWKFMSSAGIGDAGKKEQKASNSSKLFMQLQGLLHAGRSDRINKVRKTQAWGQQDSCANVSQECNGQAWI